ncbi:sortase B [Ruminococcus albus]|uniref:Sortase B n=2 Tax=Ruminococcus albus TaxID=1264 RepID=A0A1H7LB81_RUMAL|nr:sortase B [Ruminococcus albus]
MFRSARFRAAAILLAVAVSLAVLRQFRTSAVHFVSSDINAAETSQTSGDDSDISSDDTKTHAAALREEQAIVLTSAEKARGSYEEIIREKLKQLSKECPDLIGWLYVEDSNIDYPIVQGNDNQYYLHHGADGLENEHGAIFLDKICRADFSDDQSILYGHNMGDTMFGDIRKFRDPAEFEKHRSGRLITMTASYRIEFFALAIVSAFDTVYDVPAPKTQWVDIIRSNSICLADTELTDEDRYIALSTCSFDYENARFLFVGKLIDTTKSEK